ncbi:hypothetical protein Prudu_011347 [Prunus dulcis]|uniref:Uncharacterized protein n=1 Tax=Prunus dulcis TaxID=3755 RepID=A0A4Y1RAD9_PRUDU|nr:hypothetical protein Prudu_011347 [Prunus dulcis]
MSCRRREKRPTLGEVLWHLEYVLQLHEAWMRTNAGDNSFTSSQAFGALVEGEAEEEKDLRV